MDGYLGCFHLLATVSNAAVIVSVQVSLQVPAFNPLGTHPELELLAHMVTLCLIYAETARPFPTAVHEGPHLRLTVEPKAMGRKPTISFSHRLLFLKNYS